MSTLAHPGRTLDTHEVPDAERLAALLHIFDALAPGESVEFRSDHNQNHALDHLRRQRPGQFEWSPLESGPEIWRTSITRRAIPAGRRAILEALEWDHDRLDALERDAFAAREAGDYALATRLFHDFAHGLRRHIGFEEALLFPAFESRAGARWQNGPTFVMRQEHREIEQRLHDMECRFGEPLDPLIGARAAFHSLMHEHNVKEEHMLYPATDRLLTEDERDELVAQVQAFTG